MTLVVYMYQNGIAVLKPVKVLYRREKSVGPTLPVKEPPKYVQPALGKVTRNSVTTRNGLGMDLRSIRVNQ